MSERKKDFPFSDEELEKAAGLVQASLLSSLPEEPEQPHTFSRSFVEKMDRLLLREKARRTRRRFLRSAAAVLAVILTVGAVWLATDAEARAGFQRWIRHISGTDVVYEYFGVTPSESLPEYEITWLPEGYVFSFEMEENDGIARRIAYENPGEDILFFTYGYMSEDNETTVTGDTPAGFEPVTVAGMEGDLYYNEGPGSNVLGWFDEEAGIHFGLQTNLDRETMFRIAESVRLVP